MSIFNRKNKKENTFNKVNINFTSSENTKEKENTNKKQNYHKEKCEELRKIRVEVAKKLGIPNSIRKEPCNFEGNCSGTCPACAIEEKILMERIYDIYKSNSNMQTSCTEVYDRGDTPFSYGYEDGILEGDIAVVDDAFEGELINEIDEYEQYNNEIGNNYMPNDNFPLTGLIK